MDYAFSPYNYYGTPDPAESISDFAEIFTIFGGGFLIFLFIVLFVTFALAIALYVFQAIGISKMMQRLNLSNSWMAYIPILNSYAFGKVAEQYVKKNGKKSAKFSLILLLGGFVVSFISSSLMVISFIFGFASGSGAQAAGVMLLFLMFALVLTIACEYALLAIQYVALWRIFAIFANKNATLYLILSIFISVSPFLIFASRNGEISCVENLEEVEAEADADASEVVKF